MKLVKNILLLVLVLVASSCMKGKDADLIVHNAIIHTMDEALTIHEAMAIKDGVILATGPEREILNEYSGVKEINANQKEIYPGLHDAHGHILSLAKKNLICDLTGTSSKDQLITRLQRYQQIKQEAFIEGRGWDQSLWGNSALPTNDFLNEAFPDTPVAVTRVDGHAMLLNDTAIALTGFNKNTEIEGGKIVLKDDKLTGLILDNAIDEAKTFFPHPSKENLKKAILDIQEKLIEYGITNVHEAGVTLKEYKILSELSDEGLLKVHVYAMLFPDEDALAFAEKEGHIYKNNLTLRSFKIIGDGALGSRGACLSNPYSDDIHNHGFMLKNFADFYSISNRAKKINYQVNTHCIGDSTNRFMLQLIDSLFENEDHRWRIEHAQVMNLEDIALFSKSGAIPSVQPTHAVSDQRWAQQRLGKERLAGAYAYNTLLKERSIIAFGTDFPIEDINPFLTIHAAVNRKTEDGVPAQGFLINEAVSFDECMMAMTNWAAIASFQEAKNGSLEKNKEATFVILDNPLGNAKTYHPNYAWKTYVKGKCVFDME